jgi:hypothetical protein
MQLPLEKQVSQLLPPGQASQLPELLYFPDAQDIQFDLPDPVHPSQAALQIEQTETKLLKYPNLHGQLVEERVLKFDASHDRQLLELPPLQVRQE